MKAKISIVCCLCIVSLAAGFYASYRKETAHQNMDREAICSLLEAAQKAVTNFTVNPSDEKFDDAATYCIDNVSKFSLVEGKGDYILKRIYKKIADENLQGSILANIRPKMDYRDHFHKIQARGYCHCRYHRNVGE